jgi:hypothetical protein
MFAAFNNMHDTRTKARANEPDARPRCSDFGLPGMNLNQRSVMSDLLVNA